MPLTDTAVRNAKRRERPQKLSDGSGLTGVWPSLLGQLADRIVAFLRERRKTIRL